MAQRLFVGIPVPISIQKSLTVYTRSLPQDNIRFVKPENYHITLSFFGEQDEKKIGDISKILQEITSSVMPFILLFDRISFAPPKQQPNMIWANYQKNYDFTEFVNRVEQAITSIITFADQRNGHAPIPHITVARFKHFVLPELPQIALDAIPVSSVSLFESKLTDNGPIYTELDQFPLSVS